MKSGFKNVLKSDDGDHGKYPFDFKSPAYDQRSSCYIQAGCDHGVGHRQPIGKDKAGNKSPIPDGAKRIDIKVEPLKF